MATSTKIYRISQGSPPETEAGIRFLGTGSQGTRRALRRLVHPDTNLAPLVYFANPDRTLGLDNVVLPHPITKATTALEGTKVHRFDRETEDVIITEVWTADEVKLSMPTFFFRLLYELLDNEPTFDPVTPVYIQWEPRDRNSLTYNVEFLSFTAGGGAEGEFFDVIDFRPSGGIYDPDRPSDVMGVLDDLTTLETGVLDVEIRLVFRIVGLAS
jgi:hypothetical protein